ncbi:MAG: E3 binding domain-containing protein [Rhizobiaceae bacterium]|nr:E3 binding domain-containing protein [Rhizobiaceae bacterium]
MNVPFRQFVSPYARKLARERGIALVDITGGGPMGRIVAADILSFTKAPVAVSDVAVPPTHDASHREPAVVVGVIASTVDLGKLQNLRAQFSAVQLSISVDSFFVRAAGRGLAQLQLQGAIGWETGIGSERREIEIADAVGSSLGVLQSRIEATEPFVADLKPPVSLLIRRITQSRVRAVSMPPLPGHGMRLVIRAIGDNAIECTLSFDTGRVNEDDAIGFLAQFTDDLEAPFGLLA